MILKTFTLSVKKATLDFYAWLKNELYRLVSLVNENIRQAGTSLTYCKPDVNQITLDSLTAVQEFYITNSDATLTINYKQLYLTKVVLFISNDKTISFYNQKTLEETNFSFSTSTLKKLEFYLVPESTEITIIEL